MSRYGLSAVAAALVCLVGSSPAYASTVLSSTHNGWYKSTGFNVPSNSNTITGHDTTGEFRSFYVFDLTSVGPASQISVTFIGNNGLFASDSSSETLGLFDFTGSVASLVSGTGGLSAFSDLGTGSLLGQHTIAAQDFTAMPQFTVNLAPAFVSQFNANRLAGETHIAFGAALTTITAGGGGLEAFWAGSGILPAAFLTVAPAEITGAIPEPSTWAMLIVGFGAVGVGMRASRRRQTALAAA